MMFCFTGNSPISISPTWHIFSSSPVPQELCYHDQARRKLPKWHPVIFHAGIKCCFTMKSFGLVYKIQSTSGVGISSWIPLFDWQIGVIWSHFEENSMVWCHSCQKSPPEAWSVTFTADSATCWDLAPHSLYPYGFGPSKVQGDADSNPCLWKGVLGILTKSSCPLHRAVPHFSGCCC